MSARLRPLLLDVPVAVLVGVFSLAAARLAGEFQPTGGSPMGPPWMQPGRGGGRRMPFEMPQSLHLGEPYTWSALLWVLILVIGVASRRIRPFTGFSLTVVGATGYLAVGLPFGPVMIAPALGLLALATRMPVRRWGPWAVLLLPLIWAGFVGEDHAGLTDPNFYTGIVLGPPLIMVPALIATIRRVRTEENRRAHDLELRRAAFQERLTIARDVHDLIGHSLSVINMQAGVALYLLGKDTVPGTDRRIEDSLHAIRSTSKNALDELRTTLAVFRGETADERAPVSGLARLPELVDSFRSAGRMVDVRSQGRIDDLPGAVDNAAYRVIQEALTNVARHANGADASVMIRRTTGQLLVDVTDTGPGVPGDDWDSGGQTKGSGLIGMSERARAVGGVVFAGPRPSGGFVVHAEFPLPASAGRP